MGGSRRGVGTGDTAAAEVNEYRSSSSSWSLKMHLERFMVRQLAARTNLSTVG